MNYLQLNGHTIRKGFNQFNDQNPHVYQKFEEQALKAIGKGRTKISAKLIINWIRWHEFMETNDLNFKINDAYQSYYARLFAEKHPEHSTVFDFRKLRNEEGGPYMEEHPDGKINFC